MKRSSLADADFDNDVDKPSDAVIEDSHLHHEHNARLTRKILFKTDTRVLPILALLFLCSFLDRTNVGNAKIIGLEEDLEISNLQYNQGLAVFYATYIARLVHDWHALLRPIHARTIRNATLACNSMVVLTTDTSIMSIRWITSLSSTLCSQTTS